MEEGHNHSKTFNIVCDLNVRDSFALIEKGEAKHRLYLTIDVWKEAIINRDKN